MLYVCSYIITVVICPTSWISFYDASLMIFLKTAFLYTTTIATLLVQAGLVIHYRIEGYICWVFIFVMRL